MTPKRIALAAALLLGASLGMSTAGLAQAYYGGTYGPHYYDYARAPAFARSYNYGPPANDCERGGPGPRVGCGSGLGIGSQR
ncbi:MAG: hypothetical protein ACRECV_20370 [Xanthobacteraceae bacterium]